MTEIVHAGNREDFDRIGAEIIESEIRRLLKQQDEVVFAIPGGTSVSGIFKELAMRNIDWYKVHIFMVDERLVPLKHKDSNYRLARDAFITKLIDGDRICLSNLHPYRYHDGMKHYEEELKKHGGSYDIVLLSSGEDGHIGALYPNHHSFDDDSPMYIKMNDSPKPPKERMTMSRELLLRSRFVLLLFLGEGKKEAYRRFHDMGVDFRDCPAKLVWRVKNSVVLTDQDG